MKKIFGLIILLIPLNFLIAQPAQQFAVLGDFRTERGSVIEDCKIGYRLFGKLNDDKSNVVLWPTWFGGTTEHLIGLIGEDKLIDDREYFVIAVDALGNGVSSSPSNSKSQPGTEFPQITIADMVRSQYLLLTEKLNIEHLHAIIGGSMGGMQTFEWVVTFPDFMDKAIPYVGSPRLSAYDLMLHMLRLEIIEAGRQYGCPDDTLLGLIRSVEHLVARTPDHFARNTKREAVPEIITDFMKNQSPAFTLDNYAAQLQAMVSHNVARNFDNNLKAAAKQINAEVFVIVGLQDHIVHPAPALAFAELINARTLTLDSDCGHLCVGCEMDTVKQAVAQFLKE